MDSPALAKESARPMIFGEDTEAMVMPMRRGPCFWRLPSCVPFSEKKHHSTRSPCKHGMELGQHKNVAHGRGRGREAGDSPGGSAGPSC